MNGIIPEEDIAAVREQVNLAEVVSDYVTLQRAGGDSWKGLCPFHEEKTPSFNVRSTNGFFHCFGCGVGGDVYTFLQKIEQISFTEAVEKLAQRIGYKLNYQGGGAKLVKEKGTRARLLAINEEAMKFYVKVLHDARVAKPAYDFLKSKAFTMQDAELFDCGFSPNRWNELTNFLIKKGFEVSELEAAGITKRSSKGPIDRFRGRLMWPIKNPAGEVLGFGARKVLAEDNLAKYLNTPETALYKKSRVLFGLDLAKKEIANKKQVVVVEGYTDVMAMHVAGIKTAVAACGTAFGEEHLAIIRRMLLDDSFDKTEIIYTFDGDSAGIAAAIKAFAGDQQFMGQSYVTVMPEGLDPCEVRQQFGDDRLQELVEKRIPLFEFVIKHSLTEYDLDNPAGVLRALDNTIPIVAAIKDKSLLDYYAQKLAGWVGWLDTNQIVRRVRLAAKNINNSDTKSLLKRFSAKEENNGKIENTQLVKKIQALDSKEFYLQRESLKLILQHRELSKDFINLLQAEYFFADEYKTIFLLLGDNSYRLNLSDLDKLISKYPTKVEADLLKSLLSVLHTESIKYSGKDSLSYYIERIFVSLQKEWIKKEINSLRSKLNRTDANTDRETYHELNMDLRDLERYQAELEQKFG